MRRLLVLFSISAIASISQAHHPERKCQEVTPRIDVIGPIGATHKPSHRRVYNRPTYIGGKLAYLFAPSSQEAMAWHKAEHRGAYKNDCGRIEPRYFYPKPWEALRTGPRIAKAKQDTGSATLTPVDGTDIPLMPSRYGVEKPADGAEDSMAFGDSESEGARADIPKGPIGSSNIIDEELPPAPKPNDQMKDAIEGAIEEAVDQGRSIGSGLLES